MATRHPFPLNDLLVGTPSTGNVLGVPALLTHGTVVFLYSDAACTIALNAMTADGVTLINQVTVSGVTIPKFLGPVDDVLTTVYGLKEGDTGPGFPLYRIDALGSGGGGGATTLDALTDVAITGHTAGDMLVDDGTNYVDTPTTATGRGVLAAANQAALTALLAAATTGAAGIVPLATSAEALTGTDAAKAITAATLQAKLNALLTGAPAALDTLDELAAALGDDANFAATMTTALSGKQAADSDLTAIAALVSAANKLPYATGAGAWSLADFTAAGRALVDDADASAQLTTLGVSTFIKTLLDDADAATARGTIGAASAVANFGPSTVANAATPTPAMAQERTFMALTGLTGAAAFANPTGSPADGYTLTVRIKDNGTARALTFPGTQYRDAGPGFPTTTIVGKTMYLGFVWNAAETKLDLVSKTSVP